MKRFGTAGVCVALLVACAGREPGGPQGEELAELQVQVSGLAATPVRTLVVEVTAADIASPLVANLPVTDGVASGSLQVPPGAARLFTLRAFDADGRLTHDGSRTIDVVRGANPPLTLVLTARSGHVPIDVTLGSVTVTVTPATATLAAGATLQLTATVRDASGAVLIVPVVWATSNPTIATVSASGLVTAQPAGGQVFVTAVHADVAAHATLSVTPSSTAVCGDGRTEGAEGCDDGNAVPFDGCTPQCGLEPRCTDGTCTVACGDGVVSPGEACDDGNRTPSDGCSAICTVESGFSCATAAAPTASSLSLPALHRDFRGAELAGGHADFESAVGAEQGIVQAALGADGRPVYAKEGLSSLTTHGRSNFDTWFRSTAGTNRPLVGSLALTRPADGDVYASAAGMYFPLDAAGWVATGEEPTRTGADGLAHNFHFTTEVRTWFAYRGGEQLSVRADDDTWVFVNGRLVVDLGGVQSLAQGARTLDASTAMQLGLVAGRPYELAVFHADRHTAQSSFQLSLAGFARPGSVCSPQ